MPAPSKARWSSRVRRVPNSLERPPTARFESTRASLRHVAIAARARRLGPLARRDDAAGDRSRRARRRHARRNRRCERGVAKPRLLDYVRFCPANSAHSICDGVLDTSRNPEALAAALRSLAPLARDRDHEMAVRFTNHKESIVALSALRVLRKCVRSEDRELLVKMTSHHDYWVRLRAAEAAVQLFVTTRACARVFREPRRPVCTRRHGTGSRRKGHDRAAQMIHAISIGRCHCGRVFSLHLFHRDQLVLFLHRIDRAFAASVVCKTSLSRPGTAFLLNARPTRDLRGPRV